MLSQARSGHDKGKATAAAQNSEKSFRAEGENTSTVKLEAGFRFFVSFLRESSAKQAEEINGY